MERLTYMHDYGYGVLKDFLDPCEAITKLAEYEDSGFTPERVAEFAEAERNGRLVELKVAIGEKVRHLIADYIFTVYSIDIIGNHPSVVYRCGNEGTDDYTAFFEYEYGERFTRAEAEAALAAQKGGDAP